MPEALQGQQAVDRIKWLLNNRRGDVLGRVTFRDYDCLALRNVVALAEKALHTDSQSSETVRPSGTETISERRMREEFNNGKDC